MTTPRLGAGAAERVGYCRPPLATRFKPGQSGNPAGRPNRFRTLARLLAQELDERILVPDDNGRLRNMTKLEASLKQLADRATSGEESAFRMVLSLFKADLDHPPPAPAPERLGDNDALVLAELFRRFGPPQPAAAPPPPDATASPPEQER